MPKFNHWFGTQLHNYPIEIQETDADGKDETGAATTDLLRVKNKAGTNVFTVTNSGSPSLPWLNAKNYGAKGDGIANDTVAIQTAWTAYLAGPYGAFFVPNGTYNIDLGAVDANLLVAQGRNGIRVEAGAATFNDIHDYTAVQATHRLVGLHGCKNAVVRLGKVTSTSTPILHPNGDRGLIGLDLEPFNGVGTSNVDFMGDLDGCLMGVRCYRIGADPEAYKAKNLRILLKTFNTFYPLSFQFSGDNVEVWADIERCGRAYFPYGIKNHQIHLKVKYQKISCIIGGGTDGALDAPYCGCEDIDLWVYNRESDGGPWGGAGGDMIQMMWRWDAAAPGAVTHRNIHIRLNMKNNNAGGTQWGFNRAVGFRKQIVGGADDTTGRGHALENFRLTGVLDMSGSTFSLPVDNIFGTFAGGDFFRNCETDLVLTGSLAPVYPPGYSVNSLTYGTTIATDPYLGKRFRITVTNATAFTISNPTSPSNGMQITYDILNSSGGAMGAITWGAAFKLAGAFTNPANTFRRTITFYYDGTNWVETNRAGADI